jgi:hypothetical protein
VKQQNTRIALAEHPRAEGETTMKYCRKIASIAGVSPGLVHATMKMLRCEQVGAAVRAKEAEAAKFALAPLSLNQAAVQVPDFKGWADVFSRFKLLSEAYLRIAMARQDAYAESFLKDLRDHADRAESRSWLDRSTY